MVMGAREEHRIIFGCDDLSSGKTLEMLSTPLMKFIDHLDLDLDNSSLA